MKSEFKKLLKNDYFEVVYETLLWSVIGYVLPILESGQIFNWLSFKVAIISGLSMGIKKAIKLYLSNSEGRFMAKENKLNVAPTETIKNAQ